MLGARTPTARLQGAPSGRSTAGSPSGPHVSIPGGPTVPGTYLIPCSTTLSSSMQDARVRDLGSQEQGPAPRHAVADKHAAAAHPGRQAPTGPAGQLPCSICCIQGQGAGPACIYATPMLAFTCTCAMPCILSSIEGCIGTWGAWCSSHLAAPRGA